MISVQKIQEPLASFKVLRPFGWAALTWLSLAAVLCLGWDSQGFPGALGWMVGLWALSLLDLMSLARLIAAVFELSSGSADRRPVAAIQIMVWGAAKLSCLVFFILILMNGEAIPTMGLLAGLATLVVVPLGGGLLWSRQIERKDLQHA